MTAKRIAVFASGRGSNLGALMGAFPLTSDRAQVVLVLSNVQNAFALERAAGVGVEAVYLPWIRGGRAAFEEKALALLEARSIDLVCLAGFMRLLSSEFTAKLSGRLINIHPSLLPRFPGLEAQKQALEAGATVTGATVHYVDAGVDTGEIILQRSLEILDSDTVESLSERLLELEHELYVDGVKKVLEGL